MAYRVTLLWATVIIAVGYVVMIAGVIVGVTVAVVPDEWLSRLSMTGASPEGADAARTAVAAGRRMARVAAGALTIIGGFVLGIPLVVGGQLVRVLLDIRRRLVRMDRRFARWQQAERKAPQPRGVDRLIPR